MAHPTRWILNNKTPCYRPGLNETLKTLSLRLPNAAYINDVLYYTQDSTPIDLAHAEIDMYQAPDVIFSYPKGDNTKDEYQRYYRQIFDNLTILNAGYDYGGDNVVEVTFRYETYECKMWNYNDVEMIRDIPIGKLSGKSVEEIRERHKILYSQFKGSLQNIKEIK